MPACPCPPSHTVVQAKLFDHCFENVRAPCKPIERLVPKRQNFLPLVSRPHSQFRIVKRDWLAGAVLRQNEAFWIVGNLRRLAATFRQPHRHPYAPPLRPNNNNARQPQRATFLATGQSCERQPNNRQWQERRISLHISGRNHRHCSRPVLKTSPSASKSVKSDPLQTVT